MRMSFATRVCLGAGIEPCSRPKRREHTTRRAIEVVFDLGVLVCVVIAVPVVVEG